MNESKTVEIVIDGERYLIGLFGATDGYEIQQMLFEIIVPSLTALIPDLDNFIGKDFKSISNKDLVEIFSTINFQQAALTLVGTIQTKSLTELLKTLHSVAFWNAQKVSDIFDMHFAKRYKAGIQLGIEVCKHNGFLDLIMDLMKDLRAKKAAGTVLKSQKPVTTK